MFIDPLITEHGRLQVIRVSSYSKQQHSLIDSQAPLTF